jgi:hypothetical protein
MAAVHNSHLTFSSEEITNERLEYFAKTDYKRAYILFKESFCKSAITNMATVLKFEDIFLKSLT